VLFCASACPQGQLEAKETEIKRMRVEFTSERKRLEKVRCCSCPRGAAPSVSCFKSICLHPTKLPLSAGLQQIEALQRECNESAQEIQRLRDGEGSRLPPLRGPITIQEELAHLKR
jgi:hypothetical protein